MHDYSHWSEEQIDEHFAIVGTEAVQDVHLSETEGHKIADMLRGHWSDVWEQLALRLKGETIQEVAHAAYQAIVTGSHFFISGPPGTAKTTVVRMLCETIGWPWNRYDAQPDTSDMQLLGGQKVVGDDFAFVPGVLLQPGIVVTIIDELPRLSPSVGNLLLQPMEERSASVSDLGAQGTGSRRASLSPAWTLLATGNPFTYGGSAQKNEAVMDRFAIGLSMQHPDHEARIEMLKAQGRAQTRVVPMPIQFNRVRAALNLVKTRASEKILNPVVNVSFLCSPSQFRRRVGWNSCSFEPRNSRERRQIRELENMVDEHLVEGSNPRGEELILHNAAGLALLDGKLDVALEHLRRASELALRFRLRAYPGSEDFVDLIINKALDLVLPHTRME